MNDNINHWLKLINQTNAITKQFSIASQWTDIIKSNSFANSFATSSMLSQITKAASFDKAFTQRTKSIDHLTRGAAFDFTKNFYIPEKTVDTILSIGNRQNDFFQKFNNNFYNSVKSNALLSANFNNLQFALSGISGQVAAISAHQKNWAVLEDFEKINEKAISISEEILSETITNEQKIRLQELVEQIITFLKSNKKFAINALFFISVLVNFMNIHQYVDFIKDKPEAVTKQDLDNFKTTLISEIVSKLKEQKEYRTTKRKCPVMLKPKSKTLVIGTLPVDFEVVVLRTYHKWVFVSYIDIDLNLSQTGWVLKKYLDKPKSK